MTAFIAIDPLSSVIALQLEKRRRGVQGTVSAANAANLFNQGIARNIADKPTES